MGRKKKVVDEKLKKTSTLIQSYKTVFSGPDGKDVLDDLLNHCHFKQSTYNGDANDTFFNEGERAVALYILTKLNTDIDKLREAIINNNTGENNYV